MFSIEDTNWPSLGPRINPLKNIFEPHKTHSNGSTFIRAVIIDAKLKTIGLIEVLVKIDLAW